jgi:4-amino-4-deoxy-L-arabinose transferase-like glycosyltransferase
VSDLDSRRKLGLSHEVLLGGVAPLNASSLFKEPDAIGRRAIVPVLIILIWACSVVPNLAVRSFIWEEGTYAGIAKDILTGGDLFQRFIYATRWVETPSLLPWLIAGVAAVTGEVNEWSARLPAMISVLLTALLVARITRRYASANASLVAALSFLFSPLLLQKLTIAEPDTVVTLLSFGTFVLWWNGEAAGRATTVRWIACGCLLAALTMAKGPQPAGYFVLGVGAYLVVRRKWSDLPGFLICVGLPAVAIIAWGIIVHRPGDEAVWLRYARLSAGPPAFSDYLAGVARVLGMTFVELVPAILLVPFAPHPWGARRATSDVPPDVPAVAAPLWLYSTACTAALIVWPGAAARYAMPIAPAVCVLAGLAWDALETSRYSWLRRLTGTLLCVLVVYQLVLALVVMPLYAKAFGGSRLAGEQITRAIDSAPAPAFCTGLPTNQLFYVRAPLRCISETELASIPPPAWLIVPRSSVPAVEQLRPDLDARIAVETESGPQLTAIRLVRK